MYPREQYRFTVKRPYPPLFMSMFCEGYANGENFKGLYDGEFSQPNFMALENGDLHYLASELEKSARLGFEAMMKPGGLERIKKELLKREKHFIKVAKEGDLKRFSDAYEHYAPAILVAWSQENLVVETLKLLLGKKLSASETEALLGQLNVPMEDNFYKQEEYDLVTGENIVQHVKKYEWIKSRYGKKDPYTVEGAAKKLADMDKKEFLKKWKEEKEETKKAIEKAKKLLGKEAILVDIMQYIVYYRTQRTDIINKAIYFFMPALGKIAAGKGVSYEQALHCLPSELGGEVPAAGILNERIKGCSVIMVDAEIRCLHGKENQEVVEYFRVETRDIKELKGNPACQGIVSGEVRVLLKADDHHKIKKGEVLVASMTTPNMIGAMKRAAAFVTNEGGITCHAAIISREMKKPCVIGTKIATQVFKDGDRVEVDADEGVVKLLGKVK